MNNYQKIEFDFKKGFFSGVKKIKELPKFHKFMTYLWILGPFIYLIERDPADLWLTSISIAFLFRCYIKKDWRWSGQLWFIFAFLLWMISLLAALSGPYDSYSFFQGFVWIRFPIYVAAAQVWLGQDRDIRITMFISIFIGMILMCLILILEILVEGPKERLTWPYGDLVPGSYLAKVSLPIFCVLIYTMINNFNKNSILSLFSVLLSLFLIFLSGERGNFLIRFFSGILSIFSTNVKKSKIIKSFFVLLIFLTTSYFLVLSFNKKIVDRYTNHFFKSIPIINITDDNPYWGAWRSGIQQGLQKPILGLGPSSSRKHCSKMLEQDTSWLPGKNYCGNHPHNFYIQLFAETGIIGLIFGTLMFYFIFYTCFSGRNNIPQCPMISISYIIPLAFFFPLQQTGSFFGQWGNLFIWFPIGFCMAQIQDYKSIFKK